ncbi:MAG: PQQ-binding-like beta-propeller repeat protein [Hyphomicrobiaceae bacterium]|nr:PQQ-binding-like beta-propeller repeat protein [Hyphomicrobiaceae bacterium]
MMLKAGTAVALVLSLSGLAAYAEPITADRLKAAATDTANWLTHGRDYSNQRFSPLDQVNTGTIKTLVPKWIYQTGVAATFQTTPLVADGIMYLSAPFSHVIALDAKSGRELWRYEHKKKQEKLCCGPSNRGVALGEGLVYVATVDARLVALDAKSGKVAWDLALAGDTAQAVATEDKRARGEHLGDRDITGSTGVGASAAPLVYDGMVIAGITGVGYGLHLDGARPGVPLGAVIGVAGRYGRPGFMAAYDAKTGKQVWQFDTTQQGWEGEFRQTTPDGVPLPRDIAAEKAAAPKFADAWKFGGGSIWHSPAVDTERGLIYFGIGNPSPQSIDDTRPGDNLYASSLVAVEAKTGKLVWHYQQIPHDLWGYDVASPPVLFDVTVDGKSIPAVGQAGKLGWYYVHDRRDGTLLFKSDAFVPQSNLFAKPSPEGVTIAPGAGGGTNWSPTSVDEAGGLAFVAALHLPMRYVIREIPADGDKPAIKTSAFETIEGGEKWGTLTAIDLKAKGKILWQQKTDDPLIGGVLATAGGLVFTGEGKGDLSAFDAKSGEKLWSFNCGAGVNAPPISFAVEGKQYVAVAAGGNQLFGYRQGGAVVVFGLPD